VLKDKHNGPICWRISSSKGKDQGQLVLKKSISHFAVTGLRYFGSVAGCGLLKSAQVHLAPATHLIYIMEQILLFMTQSNYNWQERFFSRALADLIQI